MRALSTLVQRCLQPLRPGLGQLQVHPPRPLAPLAAPSHTVGEEARLPRISIVVPSFNQGRFLARTLESILAQDYPDLELIVVDGGSSDESAQVIRRYADRLAWWVSEPDHGQAEAINKGFRHASGEILAWINSDDLVAPGALREVAHCLRTRPEIQAVYGDRIVIDSEDREVGRWTLPFHSDLVLRWVDFVPQETLYWRRQAWEQVGAQVDENLHFALDWDLVLRFLAQGMRFAHLPRVLGMFRTHDSQKTAARIGDTGQREMQLLRQRELGFAPGRLRILARVLPYLLAARICELRARLVPNSSGSC